MYEHKPPPVLKCILIGNSGVGKSSLVCHFTENKFSDQDTTIGVEFGSKIIRIDDDPYKLQVWDTAGQETFRAITKSYYRMAMGVLLVYDVTNRISFCDIPGWYRSIIENCAEGIPIVLVGNKSDRPESQRKVTYREGQELANQYNIKFCETTAKSFDSTKMAFQYVAEKIIREGFVDKSITDTKMTDESLSRLQGLINRKPKKGGKFSNCC